jgi:outer membrane protein
LTLSLEDAVEMALKQNLDVSLAELNLRFLESQHRAIFGLGLPDVTLTGDYTRNFDRPPFFFSGNKSEVGSVNSLRAGVRLEQPIYSGGKLREGLQAARLGIEAGKEDLRGAKDEITLAVKSLFYSVLLASTTAAIQEDTLASAEEHLRTIKDRFNQGVDSDLTLLRQEVAVANVKPVVIQSRNLVDLSLTLLKDAMGIDVDRPVLLIGRLDPAHRKLPTYTELSRLALDHHPEFQAAQRNAEAAKSLVRAAAGDRHPQLSLLADFQWYAESDDLSPGSNEMATSAAGWLRLRYPLFTGGEIRERVRQANLEYERAQTLANKLERSVRVAVKRNWLAVMEASERAESQESAIGQARRALEATEVRYKAGQSSQLELNDTTLALNRARMQHTQALHDFLAALAALERAAGTRLEEIEP